MSALDDRRQRACEAFWDSTFPTRGVAAAIEVATRVKIEPEFVTAMLTEVDRIGVQRGGIEAGLGAAFRAAGFEVVE